MKAIMLRKKCNALLYLHIPGFNHNLTDEVIAVRIQDIHVYIMT